MNVVEQCVVFDCNGDRLVGVLAQPERALPLAVLVIVGGPQYRAGSHRHFVQMARHLASLGYPVLRFDVRGMGDSGGVNRSFEHLDDDIAAAAAALLQRLAPHTRLVLWGLCDGASAALLYLDRRSDSRVVGLAVLNPWVRSLETLARTQVKHYYLQRLLQAGFWTKLLGGGIGWSAMKGLLGSVRTATRRSRKAGNEVPSFQDRMARQWRRFDGQMLLMLSENDYTAREFEECVGRDSAWSGALARQNLTLVSLKDADHTLSSESTRAQFGQHLVNWLRLLELERHSP